MIGGVLALAGALVPGPFPGDGDDWPHWRGPRFNGAGEGEGLPVEWSTTENLAWKAELLGPSAATPIVWGDRIFLCALEEDTQNLLALCLDRSNGEILWGEPCGTGAVARCCRPCIRRHGSRSTSCCRWT